MVKAMTSNINRHVFWLAHNVHQTKLTMEIVIENDDNLIGIEIEE